MPFSSDSAMRITVGKILSGNMSLFEIADSPCSPLHTNVQV